MQIINIASPVTAASEILRFVVGCRRRHWTGHMCNLHASSCLILRSIAWLLVDRRFDHGQERSNPILLTLFTTPRRLDRYVPLPNCLYRLERLLCTAPYYLRSSYCHSAWHLNTALQCVKYKVTKPNSMFGLYPSAALFSVDLIQPDCSVLIALRSRIISDQNGPVKSMVVTRGNRNKMDAL